MPRTTRDRARRAASRLRTTTPLTVVIVTAVTASSLATLAPGATAPSAAATTEVVASAVIPADEAVTWARLSKTTFWAWEAVRLDVGWAVPDGASPGDTFRVDLPPELRPASTLPFDLRSDDGSLVATAVWDGRTAVVTLGDYVTGRSDVHGEVHVDVSWDGQSLGTAPTTRVLSLTGGDVTVTMLGDAQDVPLDGYAGTWGYWQRPDQGTLDLARAVGWEIRLPSRTEGFSGPVTVTYDLGPEQVLDCSSVTLRGKIGWGRGTPEYDVFATAPERVQVVRCDAHGFVLELDQVRPDENLLGGLSTDLTSTGAHEPTATLHLSHGADDQRIDARLLRTTGGGLGSGTVTPTPSEPTPAPSEPAPPSVPGPPDPGEPATPVDPGPVGPPPVDRPADPVPSDPAPPVAEPPLTPPAVVVPPVDAPPADDRDQKPESSPTPSGTHHPERQALSSEGEPEPSESSAAAAAPGARAGAPGQDRPATGAALADTGTSTDEQTATALALAGAGAVAARARRRRPSRRPR